MKLSHKQKKYIKRHQREKTEAELSANLSVPLESIREYLSTHGRVTEGTEERRPKSGIRSWIKKYLPYIVTLVVLVFIAYANSLGNGFVSDDTRGILHNPDIGSYKADFGFGLSFLRLTINTTIYKIFGLVPFYFRLLNVIFHTGSVVTLFAIITLLTNPVIAFTASAIFAVHPILVESVTWISGGSYVQYSFLLLIAFLFYIQIPKRKVYLYWSFFFFLLSLFFSEKALVLPIILLLYEVLYGNIRGNWKRLIAYFSWAALWTAANFF